ncbi:unnamed protein product [Heterobilharzia americana]|nr:unnamed protein product [Heterobilharzia americana]CAH8600007.1 unnamed protein product [Heterobilharzia americana]
MSSKTNDLYNDNDNNENTDSDFQNDLEYDRYLPMKLGFILLGVLILILLLISIYFICRRFKSHSRLFYHNPNSKSKNSDNDDDEFICFNKPENVLLTSYTQMHPPESPLITIKQQPQLLMNDSSVSEKTLFSIDDENADDSSGEANEYKPTFGYSIRHQINYVKPSVIQSTQQFIASAEMKRKNENLRKLNVSSGDQEKSDSQLAIEVSRKGIRRVSSTPNMTNLIDHQKTFKDEMNHKFSPDDDDDTRLDDYEFFRMNENDEGYGDVTLTESKEDLNSTKTNDENNESSELPTVHKPFMPVSLPNWAVERGIPERGYITFTVQMEGDLRNIKQHPLLSVQIFDVRCVLSRNVEPKAGKFYVKVRLQPAGINSSVSLLSLDQISVKSLKNLSDKMNILAVNRNSTMKSGRTPVKRAFRSPVFRHKILLHLPSDIIDCITTLSTSFDEYDESVTSLKDLNNCGMQNYELRVDLKERSAYKTNVLHGTCTGKNLPHWKSSQLVGSVRIPLTPRIWQYLVEDPAYQRRSTVINVSDIQAKEAIRQSYEILPNKTLWFIRCLHVPDENAVSRGEITFGMQYNPDNGSLIINLFNCAAMNLPKRAKNVYVRASLCSNWKLFRTVQSRPTARLSLNSAEFILGEKLNFIIEEDVSHVCIILSVIAQSGSKLHEATTLIGRCVTGPPDLACGDGLSHWTLTCSKQGMIRCTHILS